MQITTTVDVEIKAKAVFSDGKVKLSLIGMSSYDAGKRSFSVTVENGFSEELLEDFATAFEDLILEQQDILLKKLEAGRAEVVTAAARVGEM